MEKKIYVKPEAERVAFYTDEDITAVAPPVSFFANEDDDTTGDLTTSGSVGEGTGDPSWGN